MRRSRGAAAATAAAHRAVMATTALVLHFAALVLAEPFLLLNNPRPKCIEVKANEGISVNVAYEAPGELRELRGNPPRTSEATNHFVAMLIHSFYLKFKLQTQTL